MGWLVWYELFVVLPHLSLASPLPPPRLSGFVPCSLSGFADCEDGGGLATAKTDAEATEDPSHVKLQRERRRPGHCGSQRSSTSEGLQAMLIA